VTAQTWNAAEYDKNARFVSDLGAPVFQLLAPMPNERILDVGCGDGMLTMKIVEAGSRTVALDSSPDLCAVARARGLDVVESSAADMRFEREFDAVFSNAALHWMKDADRVIGNIARALRYKGRFVAEMGGYKCVETIRSALIEELDRRGHDGASASPWYFPSVEQYGAQLATAGFAVSYIELIPRPTPIPNMMGWLTTFSHCFTALLPAEERQDYLEKVQERIKPRLCDQAGNWTADYTRLRFRAVLSEPA
jgi:trans-aconitate methyltransferase